MAGALVVDRVWRRTSPERIEADLATLWRDLARETPIARALMSNLVVFVAHPAAGPVDLSAPPKGLPVELVASRHPSRVIVLYHDPTGARAAKPLAASIGVLRIGPSDARYGIEEIAVRSACGAESLASVTRALALGDLPTSIWWAEDETTLSTLTPVLREARQVLYDSRRWRDVPRAVRALAPILRDRFGPDLADLNWRRLRPVRRAIAHAVTSGSHLVPDGPSSLHVRHRPGEAALAWLLVGWWSATSGAIEPAIDVQETEGDDVLTATIAHDSVRCSLRFTATDVVVDEATGTVPFAITAAVETAADAVVSELSTLTRDQSLYDTLGALARRFASV